MNRRSFLGCLAVVITCPKWPDRKLGESMSKVRTSPNVADMTGLDGTHVALRIRSDVPIKAELEFSESTEFINSQKMEISDGQLFMPLNRYMRVLIKCKENSKGRVDIWIGAPGIMPLILEEVA